ncbi:hypothetical protein ABZ767_18510 [Streptomyces pseudogriseolus]|uniref:hypothetical protein n=1 Tax=Streptomyces pseudogriseolus TaxID=36817 RepID=UPI003475C678
MSEISEGQATSLRRLPWTEGGKTAYLSTDGGSSLLARSADVMEESMLVTAEVDANRATTLAADISASRAELRMAVQYMTRAIADAVEVARLRGERLTIHPEAQEVAEWLRRTLTT